ncbi:MAG: succinyl-diaminopimelate desuccinylase [Steroidobacteraceae bacterium]
MDSGTLDLTRQLMTRPSVTPADAGCQQILAERLEAAGFTVQRLRYGEVDNLWAERGPAAGPLLCFAGHTDVVPSGPETSWATPPFVPTEREGYLYGRGAADMKGALAAMVTATERFVTAHPEHAARLAFLLTSDEEGPALDGTRRVVEWLESQGKRIDWCVVGEPSSNERVGDTLRVGRRGSLSAWLTVHGVQGHVAYPELAENPIHTLAPALAELVARRWDEGNASFAPTSFQVSNLNAGTGAPNVIPGELKLRFNIRWSTEQTLEGLQAAVCSILDRHRLRYTIEWKVAGLPFLTRAGQLIDAASAAIRELTGSEPELSTGGGTSDGRFIAPTGAEVVELGVVNRSIHKVDEEVRIADLETLSRIYERLMESLAA